MSDTNPVDETVASRSVEQKTAALRQNLCELGSVLVAYSGGVDSAFLMKVATETLGDQALAVTADSRTIPRSELEVARNLAESIGARHMVINTDEMSDPSFVANPTDRCYHCKKTLFSTLTKLAAEQGIGCVIEGSNLDDVSDYRPGTRAIDQFNVRSPLKEVGLTKDEIRIMSKAAGLPTWDKPAAPCLSSRIPYGSEITLEKLNRIEEAEKHVRQLGFPILRVRDHGEVARIEVPREDIARLVDPDVAHSVNDRLKELGYRYVAVDLRGFRSGSLNEAIGKGPDGQD